MVFRKRDRAEDANGPIDVNLIFSPVPLHVSNLHEYLGGNLLFEPGQVFDSEARSECPLLLAAHPRLQLIALSPEGDLPNCLGYDDEGKEGCVDREVEYRVVVRKERECDE